MPHLNKRLLIFIICLCSTGVFAQSLYVAKDNISCTYGIKNETGDWVVNAEYGRLDKTFNGYFVFEENGKKGLISPTAKVIVQPKLDQISELLIVGQQKTNSRFFKIVANGKVGIIRSNATYVAKPRYTDVVVDAGFKFLLYLEENGQFESSYVDSNGTFLFDKVKGIVQPFEGNDRTIIGSEDGSDEGGRSGMIDAKGNVVIARKYDELSICSKKGVVVVKDGKTGLVNFDGEDIIPMNYEIVKSPYSPAGPICFEDHKSWRIKGETGYGLMSSTGKVLIEAQYEVFEHSPSEIVTPKFEWLIKKDGKYGVLGKDGKEVIVPIYDTLIPLPVFNKNNYRNGTKHLHYIYKKQGVYGLLDEDGSPIEEHKNDHYFADDYNGHQYLYFAEGMEVKSFDVTAHPAKEVKLEKMLAHDTIVLYKCEGHIVPFVLGKRDGKEFARIGINHFAFHNYGKLLVMNHQRGCIVYTNDGENWGGNKISSIEEGHGDYIEVYTKYGNSGYLKSNGERLTDTIYAGLDQSYHHDGYAWAKKMRASGFDFDWVLIDPKGNEVEGLSFSKPFHFENEVVAVSKGKVGVLNCEELAWKVEPMFGHVRLEGGGVYKVVTAKGRFGLINGQGEEICPVEMTSLRKVFSSVSEDEGHSKHQNEQIVWLAEKGQGQFLVDNTGRQIKDPSKVKELLLKFVFGEETEYKTNNCTECDKVLVNEAFKEFLAASGFRNDISKVITSKSRRSQRCFPEKKERLSGTTYKPSFLYVPSYRFELSYISAIGYSLRIENLDKIYDVNSPSSRSEGTEWANYVLENRQLKKVTLYDIFGSDKFLEDEFTLALSKRSDLDLDCSNISKIHRIVGSRFSLHPEGVVIYMSKRTGGADLAGVTIPWDRLKSHDSSAWLARLFE